MGDASQETTLEIGAAPAVAMALTYLAMADSIALALQNAVANQQRAQVTATTATIIVTALIIKNGT